jgi:hypothetical protein
VPRVVRFLAVFVILVVLGCVLARPAGAETIRETLETFGFFGTWAMQCGEPASPENNVRSASIAPTGDPIFTDTLSPHGEPNVYVILSARRAGDDTLVLRIKLNGRMEQELAMRRAENRIRTFGNRDPRSGAAVVRNGVVKSTGRATPWLTRCEGAAEERQRPQ